MRFEEIAIQLVDLPAVSAEHLEPWVMDCARRADLVWLVVQVARILEDMDDTLALLRSRHLDLHALGRAPDPSDDPVRVSKRALLVVTGSDRPDAARQLAAAADLLGDRWPMLTVSSMTGDGLDLLRRRTFEALDIVRVFTKQPGKPPDLSSPFALPRGATVADLAARIHKDVSSQMKYARIWGTATFEGQTVQRDHVLTDRDVIEIHL